MKTFRLLILSSFLTLFFSANASEESPDTLMVVDSPSKVLITESPEGTRIEVIDDDSDIQSLLVEYTPGSRVKAKRSMSRSIYKIPGLSCDESSYKCACSDRWVISSDGLCIGLTNALGQTGGGGLQWSKSFEISWLSCLNVGYQFSRSRIYLGLGFDWRNYKATADSKWLVPDGNDGIEWGNASEGAIVRSSRLKVFSLQLPLMYVWSVPKTWLKFKMGPILNFNTYSSLLGVYDNAVGNRCEYFTKNFDRNRVTVDFFGSVTYHNVLGIYVRYSPMKVLKAPSPINFSPLSIGVGFFI